MKKYIPIDFDEKGNAVLGNASNTPTSNGFIPTTWAPGGSDEGKQGLKSITISPAITTTPALESLFPIYWEDLTEEQRQIGVGYRQTTEMGLVVGAEYSITITPTPEWYGAYFVGEDASYGEKGEPVTFTKTITRSGVLSLQVSAVETMDEDSKYVLINLAINSK